MTCKAHVLQHRIERGLVTHGDVCIIHLPNTLVILVLRPDNWYRVFERRFFIPTINFTHCFKWMRTIIPCPSIQCEKFVSCFWKVKFLHINNAFTFPKNPFLPYKVYFTHKLMMDLAFSYLGVLFPLICIWNNLFSCNGFWSGHLQGLDKIQRVSNIPLGYVASVWKKFCKKKK